MDEKVDGFIHRYYKREKARDPLHILSPGRADTSAIAPPGKVVQEQVRTFISSHIKDYVGKGGTVVPGNQQRFTWAIAEAGGVKIIV